MTCKNIENKISLYLDGELPADQIEDLNKHIENCKECHALFEDMKLMHEIMTDMPQMELPQDFESELHDKLVVEAESMRFTNKENKNSREENKSSRKVIQIPLPSFKDFKKYSRPLTAVAATLVVAVLVYGAGSVMNFAPKSMEESYDDMAFNESAEMATESFDFAEESAPVAAMSEAPSLAKVTTTARSTGVAMDTNGDASYGTSLKSSNQSMVSGVDSNSDFIVATQADGQVESETKPELMTEKSPADSRMIIYSADVWLDIVNYDETYQKIVNMVNDMGGYVGDANTSFKYYDESDPDKSLKYGRLTIRVPQGNFMGAVDYLETIGIQKNLNIWSQDITSQYRDIANEVVNLEIREAKLREIMDRAEKIEDVITVERELSRVRGEINGYMGTLKDWERLVSLSTITIELNEVETLEPRIRPIDKTLMQKAKDGFVNSINQLKFMGERLFIGVIAFSPQLLIWAIVFLFGYKIVKWLVRKFRK